MEKQKIERLVFSGGGARGVLYIGAYAAMHETHLFDSVTHVSGTSAGALTAAFISAGMSPQSLKLKLSTMHFKKFLGEKNSIFQTERDAAPLYEFLKENIRKSIKNRLTSLQSTEQLKPKSQIIYDRLSNNSASQLITFNDIHHLYLEYPEYFKELTVTAVHAQGGALQLFNHIETPDVEIALACKASSSIPGLLKPVMINNKLYYDGGTYDNIPTEAFDAVPNKGYQNNKPQNTLVFAFIEESPRKKSIFAILLSWFDWENPFDWRAFFINPGVFNALYGSRADEVNPDRAKPQLFKPSRIEQFSRNYGLRVLTALNLAKINLHYKQTEKNEARLQTIRKKYPLRTVGLNVGNLYAVDFDRATKERDFLITSGYLDTMDMIHHHQLSSSDENVFYSDVVSSFINQYRVALERSGKKIAHDPLLAHIDTLNTDLSKYQYIRDKMTQQPKSVAAHALKEVISDRLNFHSNHALIDFLQP